MNVFLEFQSGQKDSVVLKSSDCILQIAQYLLYPSLPF